MTCTITWLDHTANIGKERFENVNNANILQAPAYGRAMAEICAQKPKIGLIDIDGQPAGYLQVLEKSALRGFLSVIALDRGPLWLDGYGTLEHFQAFLQAFRAEFPKRVGRAVRIIPEITAIQEVDKAMKNNGFRSQSAPYQSLIIDLDQDEEALKAAMKKNWRGMLNKAEKNGVTVDWATPQRHLDWLLKHYNFDKKTKGYDGASVELIQALAKEFSAEDALMIGRALKDGRAIGAVLIFSHGRGSTYQIGWNTQEGRNYGAHNLLLWQACLELKNRGFKTFDLGGVNDEGAHAVKTFKEGMGGQLFTLPGLYT